MLYVCVCVCILPPTNKNGRIPIHVAHAGGCLQWIIYIHRTKEELPDWLEGEGLYVVLIQGICA